MNLELKNLTFGYGSMSVLNNINLKIQPKCNVIIGPNAAGKSTLLKCIFGILKFKGEIFLDGKEISVLKKDKLLELIAYLPQEDSIRSSLTVFETVLLGRLHSLSWRISDKDLSDVLEILENLRIANLASRSLNELSGGQKQMVSIAQSLVNYPKLILMDEPTNSLDLQHQLEIIRLIHSITRERRITSLIVLHDLNLAARYADNVIALDGKGGIYASGKPISVITSEMIHSVYGVYAKVIIDEEGVPVVIPINSINEVDFRKNA